MWKRLTTAITTTLVWGVRGYRLAVSPLLPPSCRFTPTCSNYAIEALERKGLFAGTYLAVRRLLRCHPFHPGGYDPVERPASQEGSEGQEGSASQAGTDGQDGLVSSASVDGPVEGTASQAGSASPIGPDGSGRTGRPGVPAGHSGACGSDHPSRTTVPQRTSGPGGPFDQPHAAA